VQNLKHIFWIIKKKKAKDIRGHVVKNHMLFDDHKRCLFGDASLNEYKYNVSIRLFNHNIMTTKSNKLTYNSQDDKRYIGKPDSHITTWTLQN
jgi:hypothetical protein